MLDSYDKSIMIWTPDYFEEIGWAQIEKNTIMRQRIYDGKRFVPIILRGDRSIIPSIFQDYVPADFINYGINRSQEIFNKKMLEVIKGLRK
jgi:hypothetical protein